jgi:hypothetical protein
MPASTATAQRLPALTELPLSEEIILTLCAFVRFVSTPQHNNNTPPAYTVHLDDCFRHPLQPDALLFEYLSFRSAPFKKNTQD